MCLIVELGRSAATHYTRTHEHVQGSGLRGVITFFYKGSFCFHG